MFKGTTLGSSYEKGGKDSGIKVNKTFLVDIGLIYAEQGFNVRELDQEHIESLRLAFESGQPIPAVVGKTTPAGFKIIDGHHRFEAAKLAGVARLECKDFHGTDADVVAMMVTSSQGKNLTAVERAKAYQRLKGFGLDAAEIAEKVKRSRADVDSHLLLLTAGDSVITAVQDGQIGASVVVNALRKSGGSAPEKLADAVKQAKESGRRKVSASDLNPFTKSDYVSAMELVCQMDESVLPAALVELVRKYKSAK